MPWHILFSENIFKVSNDNNYAYNRVQIGVKNVHYVFFFLSTILYFQWRHTWFRFLFSHKLPPWIPYRVYIVPLDFVGFFLYRYVVHVYMRISDAINVSAKKPHVSFIHEVHLYTCTKLVNVCYISGFSGELVRSPVAIDLKKSKNTHST